MKKSVVKNIALLAVAAGCFVLTWIIYRGQQPDSSRAPSGEPSRVVASDEDRAGDGVEAPAALPAPPRKRPRAPRAEGQRDVFVRAAESGDATTVKALIAEGVDAKTSIDRWPPMLVAAAEGHDEVVQALIEAGADPDRRGPAKWTALMMAGAGDRPDVVRTLLAAGANPLLTNELGATFFDVVEERHAKSVQSLLREPEYRWRDTRPLIRAACSDDFNTVTRLLDEGAPVDSKDARGRTVLIVHMRHGIDTGLPDAKRKYHYDMVRLLLDRGANIDTVDPDTGRTPLMDAMFLYRIQLDPIPTVTMLLGRGASLEARDKQGRTPIELAMEVRPPDQREALVKLILSHSRSTGP